MKPFYYISFVLITVALLFTSCEHEPLFEELIPAEKIPGSGGPGGNEEDPCDPDSIYFVNDIMPILQSNCAFSGCHGDGSAEEGVDLTSYNSIMRTADVRPFNLKGSELYEKITENDKDDVMPPPPANRLSQEQIAKIAQWINQGAQNNACDNCDTTAVTFSLVISPLITNNCQGCHSGGDPAGGIQLTNFLQIQTQALSGALHGAISHSAGYTPMPYNQPKLSQCKIDQIRIWIENGAPND